MARFDAGSPLREIMNKNKPFLLLGAVSPDLPYASLQGIWADRMHYDKTNEVPLICAVNVGCGVHGGKASLDSQAAWIAGYVSHCVADATIHPIVQRIVGPYHADPETHRLCEMTQDSLLYSELRGASLRDAQFTDQLRKCKPKEVVHGILDNWVNALHIVHGDRKPWPDTDLWFAIYTKLLDAATDGDLLLKLSRAIRPMEGYMYFAADRIRNLRSKEAQEYYEEVKLPTQPESAGKFRIEGFERAINNLLPIWSDLWEAIDTAKQFGRELDKYALKQSLKNWDLDTGADMGLWDARVTAWQA